jgi:hypothetical protein
MVMTISWDFLMRNETIIYKNLLLIHKHIAGHEPRILDRTLPRLFADGGGVASLMKKTTVEMQEVPADRNMLVMNRLMKQGGVTQTRDPRLMAQLAQVLGRDG